MKAKKFETLKAGRRVQLFFVAHAEEVGAELVAKLRALIDPLVEQLTALMDEQMSSTSSGIGHTKHHEQLRIAMYERYLNSIGLTAKSALRQTPEFPNLVMRTRMSDGKFVSSVATLIDASKPHETVLVANGSPVDFIAGLQAALAAYLASIDTRGRLDSRRKAATKGIEVVEPKLRATLSQVEGALIGVLRNNPALKADWGASRKIHKRPINPLRGGSPKLDDGSDASSAVQPPPTPPTPATEPTDAENSA
jgi:hypothetical protein